MLEKYINYLVEWIREKVSKAGASGVVFGISGGIDSAVVANLAKLAFPNDHLGIYMPCQSSQLDQKCFAELIEKNKIKNTIIDIEEIYNLFLEQNAGFDLSKLAKGNTKARLRMTVLYGVGQTRKYLVLGTDNAPEWYLGYFTKFGDGGVDLLPLVNLLKRQVKEIATILNVPEIIINRQPTAGLYEGQTDENELGFSYNEIDNYLEGKEVNPEVVKKIKDLHQKSAHKRQPAPSPKKIDEV
ncbi:NAD(+) synthase [Spiroplasma endosymbiont of Aspidapion aeneum]|uniref:NAD(+) synthase n=1 Tax=Spiroplasma endosymbiont of Aspidapion aeneum TaxID=3066276 RepID=UPI00313ED5D0